MLRPGIALVAVIAQRASRCANVPRLAEESLDSEVFSRSVTRCPVH